MPLIRAVTFDLDGTLLDYDDGAYEATRLHVVRGLVEAFPALNAAQLLETHGRLNYEQWRATATVVRAPSGATEGRSIWLETWRRALTECGCLDAAAASLALELYESHRHQSYRLYDDVIEVLEALSGRLPMALITNGPSDTQRDKLRVTGIEPYFDAILVSGEFGIGKPDTAIFYEALRQIGAEPKTSLHIGDNPVADVQGALDAGMSSVWLNRTGLTGRPEDREPHHVVESLTSLTSLLE